MRISIIAILPIFLSVAGRLNFVKAEPVAHASDSAKSQVPLAKRSNTDGITFKELVDKLLQDGTDFTLGANIARNLGFTGTLPVKEYEVPKEETVHDLDRTCKVVIETADTGISTPICLIFRTTRKYKLGADSYSYRLSLDGKLEKAYLSVGKYTEDGKPIYASGVQTDLDVNSPKVKAALQHELDFWLKGMYRKPKEAVSDAKKDPSAESQPVSTP